MEYFQSDHPLLEVLVFILLIGYLLVRGAILEKRQSRKANTKTRK